MALTVTYTSFNGKLVHENRSGSESFYVPDPLDSAVAILDPSGATTDTFAYWPFGELRTRTGSTGTPFQFVGLLGYYLDSIDRFYIRARTFIGRYVSWLTLDSLWPDEPAYSYALGNPISNVDPSGQYAVVLFGGALTIIVICCIIVAVLASAVWLATHQREVEDAIADIERELKKMCKPDPGVDIDPAPPPTCPPCRRTFWRWELGCHYMKALGGCCIGLHAQHVILDYQAPYPKCTCYYRVDRDAGKCKGKFLKGKPCPPRTDPRCVQVQWFPYHGPAD